MTSRSFKEKRNLKHTRLALASASRAAKTALTRINRGMAPAGRMAGIQMQAMRRNVPARLQGNRQEIKSVDWPAGAGAGVAVLTATLSSTAGFYMLNGIQEGASFYNRIGRKIMMRSLHFIGQIVPSGNISNLAEYLRVIIIYDRQTNKNFPVIADILANYDNAGFTTTSSYSHLNMNNAERFMILADIRLDLPYVTNAATLDNEANIIDYNGEYNINRFIRLNNLEAHYTSTTNPAAIGDITTGGLYLVTFGNVAAGAQSYELQCTARLRFHDT